jgi:hypothetical protein
MNKYQIYFSWLEVGLALDVSSAGFESLSKLPNLQQFIFGEHMEECDWKHQVRFFNLCTEHLPHLKAAGRSFNVMHVAASEFRGFDCARGYHSELVKQLKRPATLSLQLLNLADDVLPEKRIKFSGLEELVLWSPSSRMLDWCDRNTSVTAVGLYECNKTGLAPVLRLLHQVGQRLDSLVLHLVREEFSLAEVLQLCPRLKRFKLSSCKVKNNPEQWPEEAFSYMKETWFDMVKLPRGFLNQVNE